ncbi:MAG: carboxy terminal-processing peptidase [Flavobacteriaceae bacterium]|nr:carboxy terminal-processing peptidase [Flavobacteriaceae bacterium]
MKKNVKFLLLALVLSAASCSFTNKTFDNPDKDKLLIELITYVLEKGHFNPKDIDDNFSKEVYKDFLEQLDPLKRYFIQSDIEEFAQYETQIDDQLQKTDLTFFNVTYDRLMQRMAESKEIYTDILDKPFNYEKQEVINVDYENLSYPKNKKELKDRWRKQLKFNTLSNYDEKITDYNDQKESDEKPEDFKTKSLDDLEQEAREASKRSFDEYYDILDDLERKDWFAIYINAIVEEFDPHTYYFAPQDKEKFDAGISGKYDGIGARLQKKMDHIKIVELISGGPAKRGKVLEVGDEIRKVRQEKEKEATSIVGMRIDDAIKLIKGPKGTKVFLTVKSADGTVKEVEIERDVVELEETYAKSSLIQKGNNKYGIINLPKFYIDFEQTESRNAASDVEKEIERLKKEGMEGLILDLRDNGGGSLRTVVEMSGLFIKDGPIVQVKSTQSRKDVLRDKDKRIQWDGPLVILVNELSASASEILAAAMQDYKRAIIIGSNQTYGKGTVQNVYDLNQSLRSSSFGDVGALKITTQKFYRINGGSTQLEGVKSDVVVPDRYSFIDVGEKDQENPLPWDKIEPTDYTVWENLINYDQAIINSKERMAKNDHLQLIEKNAKWIKERGDIMEFSLNYDDYKKRLEQAENEAKVFDPLDEYQNELKFTSLPYEIALIEKDEDLGEKRKDWHEELMKDVYVDEAVNVLQDVKFGKVNNKSKVAVLKD